MRVPVDRAIFGACLVVAGLGVGACTDRPRPNDAGPGTAGGIGTGSGGQGPGGTTAQGSGGAGGAGATTGQGGSGVGGAAGNQCASATENAPCEVPNVTCGGPCTDACQFCNLLRCADGRWQRMEAHPAPCFACGTELKCQTMTSYCQWLGGTNGSPARYACRDLPAACVATPTCSCLSAEHVAGSCTMGTDGGLTMFLAPS